MNGTISVPLITHYGYYFFCYASFDAFLVYQICLLFFPCAVINHCLFSGGFSQTSILSTLYRTHFPSENNAWQGSSQGDAHGIGDRGQSFSRGCRADKGKRWWHWHPLQVYTIQKYLQGNLIWTHFFLDFCIPFLRLFLAAIFYNVLFLCCQNMCFMLLLAFLESLQ